MSAEEHVAEDFGASYAPERWETAVEDIAQVVAMALDRAQDAADVINDLFRTRPTLARAVLAGVAGAAVGAFVVGRLPRRQAPSVAEQARAVMLDATGRGAAVVQEAAVVAREAAERLARRVPSRGDVEDVLRRRDLGRGTRNGSVRNRLAGARVGQVRYAAQLLPISVALLRNPLVRALIWRSALRLARRRK